MFSHLLIYNQLVMSSGQFSQLTGQLVTESGQFGVGVCELVTAGGQLLNTTVPLLNIFLQKAHLILNKIKYDFFLTFLASP